MLTRGPAQGQVGQPRQSPKTWRQQQWHVSQVSNFQFQMFERGKMLQAVQRIVWPATFGGNDEVELLYGCQLLQTAKLCHRAAHWGCKSQAVKIGWKSGEESTALLVAFLAASSSMQGTMPLREKGLQVVYRRSTTSKPGQDLSGTLQLDEEKSMASSSHPLGT